MSYVAPPQDIEYRFYCEFQSHEPEFDYLKSLEIEEKINRIRWRHGKAGPLFLLSTNGSFPSPFGRHPRVMGVPHSCFPSSPTLRTATLASNLTFHILATGSTL